MGEVIVWTQNTRLERGREKKKPPGRNLLVSEAIDCDAYAKLTSGSWASFRLMCVPAPPSPTHPSLFDGPLLAGEQGPGSLDRFCGGVEGPDTGLERPRLPMIHEPCAPSPPHPPNAIARWTGPCVRAVRTGVRVAMRPWCCPVSHTDGAPLTPDPHQTYWSGAPGVCLAPGYAHLSCGRACGPCGCAGVNPPPPGLLENN